MMHGAVFTGILFLLLWQTMLKADSDDTTRCDVHGDLFTSDKTKSGPVACINGVSVPMPCTPKDCLVARPKVTQRGSQSCITMCKNPATQKLSSILPDCTAVYKNGTRKGHIFMIHPDPSKVPFQAPCDLTEGGWTIIQRRFDGSVDFNRTWREYESGFSDGNLNGELWLGLDKIYQLSNRVNVNCTLRVDIKYYDSKVFRAEYKLFYIENNNDFYRLRASGYSGNAGDSLINPEMKYGGYFAANRMEFHTYDMPKGAGHKCAKTYGSGWWYNTCFDANLNGPYSENSTCIDHEKDEGKCMCWHLNGARRQALKASTMKIMCK